jgi:hypothetical protein
MRIDIKATLAALMGMPGELVTRTNPASSAVGPSTEFAVRDQDGEDSLELLLDYLVISVSWGSMSFWDRWEGEPGEPLRYTGTVGDAHRRLPAWVVFEEGGAG